MIIALLLPVLVALPLSSPSDIPTNSSSFDFHNSSSLDIYNGSSFDFLNSYSLDYHNNSSLDFPNSTFLDVRNSSFLEVHNSSFFDVQNSSFFDVQNSSLLDVQCEGNVTLVLDLDSSTNETRCVDDKWNASTSDSSTSVSSVVWPLKREAVVEGELVLGGLMMVHERGPGVKEGGSAEGWWCGPVMPQGGVQAVEAMLYTLDVLRGNFLPGVQLGALILDDCDSDTYGLEMAVDFIKGECLTMQCYQFSFLEHSSTRIYFSHPEISPGDNEGFPCPKRLNIVMFSSFSNASILAFFVSATVKSKANK
ncbi:hypothetical protein J437_LFUL002845 [Ladona fulva]|uniref:Receptor ligand binding region domain-containing protein n=1 Tax=Ladona fulva TaxID=123851 RepID=A0A8K0K3A1_LADFU|nr:hypothetical protein J437_LFUL002845 [Ladona fulva]